MIILFEEQQIYCSQKIWLEKVVIPATLLPLWETLWPMSKKVDAFASPHDLIYETFDS